MALYSRSKLWKLRDTRSAISIEDVQQDDVLISSRDETLHLLLHWSLCNPPFQDAMNRAQLESWGSVLSDSGQL